MTCNVWQEDSSDVYDANTRKFYVWPGGPFEGIAMQDILLSSLIYLFMFSLAIYASVGIVLGVVLLWQLVKWILARRRLRYAVEHQFAVNSV